MPMTHSADMGNVNGLVQSHRFPGANTAVPTANEDADQLKLTESFLKRVILSVNIFGFSREQNQSKAFSAPQPDTAPTSRRGEKAEQNIATRATEAPPNAAQPL